MPFAEHSGPLPIAEEIRAMAHNRFAGRQSFREARLNPAIGHLAFPEDDLHAFEQAT